MKLLQTMWKITMCSGIGLALGLCSCVRADINKQKEASAPIPDKPLSAFVPADPEQAKTLQNIALLYKKQLGRLCDLCIMAQKKKDAVKIEELVYMLTQSAAKIFETIKNLSAFYKQVGLSQKRIQELEGYMKRELNTWLSLAS